MTGDEIKAARQARGFTRLDVAQALGVSVNSLWNWENQGTPLRRTDKFDSLLALFERTPTLPQIEPIEAPPPVVEVAPLPPVPEIVPPPPLGAAPTLLWPWLPTAGPAYRARIHQVIHGARA